MCCVKGFCLYLQSMILYCCEWEYRRQVVLGWGDRVFMKWFKQNYCELFMTLWLFHHHSKILGRSKKHGCTESYFYKTNFWGFFKYTLSISNTWICKFLWRWVLWYELLFITLQLIKKLKFRPIQYVTKNIQWHIVWSLEFAGNGTEAEIAQAVLVHFC